MPFNYTKSKRLARKLPPTPIKLPRLFVKYCLSIQWTQKKGSGVPTVLRYSIQLTVKVSIVLPLDTKASRGAQRSAGKVEPLVKGFWANKTSISWPLSVTQVNIFSNMYRDPLVILKTTNFCCLLIQLLSRLRPPTKFMLNTITLFNGQDLVWFCFVLFCFVYFFFW